MSAVTDYKITAEDLLGKGVEGLADTPGLSTSEMQAKFEEIVRDVVIPNLNAALDEAAAELIDRYTKAQTNAQIDAKMTAMGSGDMAKSIYDPNNKGTNIFAQGTASSAGMLKLSDDLTDSESDTTTGKAATPKAVNLLNAQKAPNDHTSSTAKYGAATGTLYGHVKLSDSTNDSTGTATGGVAATPYAVKMAIQGIEPKQSYTGWRIGYYVSGYGYKIPVTSLYPLTSVTSIQWYNGTWHNASYINTDRQGLVNVIDSTAPTDGTTLSNGVYLVNLTYSTL